MAITVSHQVAVAAGYGCAVAATLAIAHLWRPRGRALYPAVQPPRFARPWLEFALAIIACIGIVLVGQVYLHIWHVPNHGRLGWIGEAVNQLAIFSPIIALLLVRRHPPESVFLARDQPLLRFAMGALAGVVGALTYGLLHLGPSMITDLADAFARFDNIPHIVQILLEGIVIICLLARLAAGMRSMAIAGAIVIILFVAGHIPTLLAGGQITGAAVTQLVLDVAIGIVALVGLLRTRDLLWFWPLHVCMDLTQFSA